MFVSNFCGFAEKSVFAFLVCFDAVTVDLSHCVNLSAAFRKDLVPSRVLEFCLSQIISQII